MYRTMMPSTEWDCEFIADLAAERTGLREAEVVGVRGLAATDEARLLGDIAKVLPVAIATRGSHGEDALVDALRLIRGGDFGGGSQLRAGNLRHQRLIVRGHSRIR